MRYNLHLDGKTVYADGLDGTIPARIAGQGGEYRFVFLPNFHDIGKLRDPKEHYDRYDLLRETGLNAGAYVLHRSSGNRFRYTEQKPEDTPSLMIGLAPDYDTPATNGIWALLDGYEEDNRHPESRLVVDISVTMIGTFEEYPDRSAVESELKVGSL